MDTYSCCCCVYALVLLEVGDVEMCLLCHSGVNALRSARRGRRVKIFDNKCCSDCCVVYAVGVNGLRSLCSSVQGSDKHRTSK